MWLLQTQPISHETLAFVLILGFLFLAALCLSERAFTQLLAWIARRGSSVEVRPPENQPPQTGSYTATEQEAHSARQGDGPTMSGPGNSS